MSDGGSGGGRGGEGAVTGRTWVPSLVRVANEFSGRAFEIATGRTWVPSLVRVACQRRNESHSGGDFFADER